MGRAGAPSCIRSTIRSSSPDRARSAARFCVTSSATCRRSSSRSAAADSSPASPATSRRCAPRCEIIGVEPYDADAMYQSLEAGRRVMLDRVGIFADGVAVREVGELTFPIVQATVERDRPGLERSRSAPRSRTSSTTRDRSWSRPARWPSPGCDPGWSAPARRGKRLAAVLSGANMNFDRLRFVAERAEVGEAREALVRRDHPGAPRRVPRVLRRHRPSGRDRVQLPVERPRPGAHLRRNRDAIAAGRRSISPRR